MICDFSNFVESRMDRLATQYRESQNLKELIETLVSPIVPVGEAICASAMIDIDTATGDQLTLIGKALGWPRIACVGVRPRTFGFDCDDGCHRDIGGFCNSYWCGSAGGPVDVLRGEFTFSDDDLYRRMLKSIVIKHDNDFRRISLIEALREIFGDGAGILREENGRVDVFALRPFSEDEFAIAHVFEQVLPIALGVGVGLYEVPNGNLFGFGDGWDGFCQGEWPVAVVKG